ncbi:MAG: GHKL domain-containing protein [Nitrospirae bacterium]|nr:GHKL domain-containing protein [Nitrospirota bacterium]
MRTYTKTAGVLLFISLIPICAVSISSYYIAKKMIVNYIDNNLDTVANIQKHRIESKIERNIERMDLITSRPPMRAALDRYMKTGEKSQREIVTGVLSEVKAVIKDNKDISILDIDGRVVVSTNASSSGRDLSREEYFVRGKNGYSMDVFSIDGNGEVSNYLSCPLLHEKRLLGILVLKSVFKPIDAITADYSEMGETGESLLARRDKNGDALYIVPLRFDQKASMRKTIPKNSITTPIIQALLKKEQTLYDAVDYRGKHVMAATRYIRETDWGLVVKTDRDEAFSPLFHLRNLFIGLAVFTMIIVVIISHFVSRSIARYVTSRKKAEDALVDVMTQLDYSNKELERSNRELEHSNRDLEQFAYVASHDLQEPLRKISGFSELLSDLMVERYAEQLDEKINKYLKYIMDGSSRMNTLINDILAYSRIGMRGKEFQPADMNNVIKLVLSNLYPLIKSTDTVITCDTLPTVTVDEMQMMQLFQNLIGNSIKYRSEEQPRVHVSAVQEGGKWLFSVRDNGIGIDMQYSGRIFEIFQRLHTKQEYSGTGIGLSICKRIVERHKGRIWVESGTGKGSTFYFTIP